MFTKVRLNNFRTFDNIEFDLTGKGSVPKKLVVVYGENGVGKSNLMSAFVLLRELLETMNVRDMYEELLSQKSVFADDRMQTLYQKAINAGLRDMRAIIDDYRMVGCEDPIEAEYEFSINGKTGSYYVQLGKTEILRERLEFVLNSRRGTYFDISKDSRFINTGIIKNADFLADVKATAKRFWGKHSIMAILLYELFDKSESFGFENLSDNFKAVLDEFFSISCSISLGTKRWNKLLTPISVLREPVSGTISVENEKQLDFAEQIFTQFFSAVNTNIRKLKYEKTFDENDIVYKLILEKLVAGKYRDIEFSRESSGNHQLLRVLCYFLTACLGKVVVMDEADSGIHDFLFKKLVQEIYEHISGQIILTTHNTMLMESEFARETTYFLHEVEDGHKVIRCVSDYEKRTYLANNIRNKYLNKEYDGLPEIREINFAALIDEMNREIAEEYE